MINQSGVCVGTFSDYLKSNFKIIEFNKRQYSCYTEKIITTIKDEFDASDESETDSYSDSFMCTRRVERFLLPKLGPAEPRRAYS